MCSEERIDVFIRLSELVGMAYDKGIGSPVLYDPSETKHVVHARFLFQGEVEIWLESPPGGLYLRESIECICINGNNTSN